MTKKTESGRLRGRVTIGHKPDGTPIYKYVSAPTRRELENVKEAVREHFIFGREIPKDQQFYQYAEQWYRLKKEPFISEASRSYYKTCFIKHLLPTFGMQHMRAITAGQLQEYVNGFAGTSRSQINNIIGTLKAIFSSAFADGVIERDPSAALIRPKASRNTGRRALTQEETVRVLDTIHTHPEGLFLAVLYYLGLRRGEALGLKWGDFDFTADQVHIQRDIDFTGSTAAEDTLKTEAADRYVPVPAELKEMLLPKRARADDYLFRTEKGAPLSQATYKRMWARLMLQCGCAQWREVKPGTSRPDDILKQVKPTLTPHYFRHNYVTLLYESGIDPLIAMKIVGHTDYQTTANIYTHLKEETLRKASVNMEKVFREKTGASAE
ncbi:MAG: site-specific integrase [Eubacteriales bacterium]|nr:site-specific integrase [Eubacteriales bacterium]